MCFLFDWLLLFFEFSTRHPAISLVVFGVFGEGFEIIAKIFWEHWYKKHERKFDKIGGVFWIIVIIGLALEIPEAAKVDKKTSENELLLANIGTTNEQLALQVSLLDSNNLTLRSNVVALELQAIEISNNVVKSDFKNNPLNQPIKSITAEVYLLILGTNFSDLRFPRPPEMEKSEALIEIMGNAGSFANMRCSEFETELTHAFDDGWVTNPPNARVYNMSFRWPNVDFASSYAEQNPHFKDWIERTNASLEKLDKQMEFVWIFVPGMIKGAEISNGLCLLTINGQLLRQFSIPKETGDIFLICPLMTTNNP
jgi:hypothetical protein